MKSVFRPHFRYIDTCTTVSFSIFSCFHLAVSNLISPSTLSIQNALNRVLLDDMKSNREQITDSVLAVEVVHRESIYGYHANHSSQFLRITLALPRLIAAAKRLLGEGKVFLPNLGTPVYEAFESNIDFEIRYCNFLGQFLPSEMCCIK